MERDSFNLNENIKVDIVISVTRSSVDIEVIIENHSNSKFMLFNKYFKFHKYFNFVDECGNKGTTRRPSMHIEYDWSVNIDSIDIIEPNTKKHYNSHLTLEEVNNSFIISNCDRRIEFINPAQVMIVLSHKNYQNEIDIMNRLVENANIVPNFNKSYVIREF